ncbi:hypothetical protein E4U41_001585, partial [Claviceps citrina]
MDHDSPPPPPSYEDAISHGIHARLSPTQHYTLVLDGRNIYPAAPPSQFLYQMSSPPCEAGPAPPSSSCSSSSSSSSSSSPTTTTCRVHKWRFRLSDPEAEGQAESQGGEPGTLL